MTVDGKYLGTICLTNRMYRFHDHPYRRYPGNPSYPGYPGYPSYPGFAGYAPLPAGARDIRIPGSE